MKAFFTVSALIGAAAGEFSQHGGEVGISLKAIHPDLEEIDGFQRWDQSSRRYGMLTREMRSPEYYATRTRETCTFPLDIVILQDLTDSFSDNLEEMKNVQLKQMIDGLKDSHPNSRFAMVSFQDKPLYPLGNRDDACWTFNADLSGDLEPIYNSYASAVSYGGADAPENQFGAILAAMGSDKISWGPISGAAARLIVVVTDAGPHHADDGAKPESGPPLSPWVGGFADDRAQDLCLKTGYPSAQTMYDQVVAHQTYIAALVFDGDWNNGWAANEWKTFNRFLAQPDAFVAPDAENSSNFWANLSKIIETLEDVECGGSTTSTTTTTPPATTTTTTPPATTTPTTAPPTLSVTTAGSPETTTEGECHPTLITDECDPTPENCYCQPDVIIKIADRPDHLNIVADDKVIV